MEILAQFIKNRYQTNLIEKVVNVENFIKNPFSLAKDECPLWNFVSIKEGKPKFRSGENYSEVHALLLDFDSNLTIEDFKKKYTNFKYFLYTTSSHIKGFCDKFRVIIPLKNPFPFNSYADRFFKESLIEYFDGIDKSCFSNFHILPNTPANKDDYYFYINESENIFDIVCEISGIYKKLKRKDEIHKSFKKCLRNESKNGDKNMTGNAKINYKNKVSEELRKELHQIPSFRNGSRYNSLLSLTGKYVNAKYPSNEYIFDEKEIKEWIGSNCRDRAVIKMVEDLCRRRGF